MDARRWARLDELFAAAEPLAEAERQAFLDASFARDPDPALRRELEELLLAAGGGAPRVEEVIAGSLSLFAGEGGPPLRLGPYLIGREIGRGGMATVYEAERDDREFERKVAVKVLRRGMETADVVRRLRRERQILANLDHPNVARLLDGGSTADGRPFVVMEHIDGQPIDQYCRERGLDLRRRLQLFRQICGAVHFAHRSLVLHRDIKPSNILVTAGGVPKLLDFGIAKILDEGEDTAGISLEPTAPGQRLLTPEWASPEQVRGEPLSTASDVYSLGLLLYLLATGERAYRVDPRKPAELERVVCENEPRPPGLGNDLDLVILAALRKEPGRRYASAEQLGEDVRRFLENLPVTARKDTAGYRARKFARRHRLALAALAAIFLTLLVAALITAQQARVAREERRRAEENLARAEQVAAFLTDIFEVSDPGEARGRALTAREVLDQGARRMRVSLHGDPRLRADLLGTMGRVYQKLGFYDEAAALLEEAAALRAAAGDRAAAAASRADLAALAFQRGQVEAALELAREALRQQRQAAAPPRELARCLKLVADIEAELDHGAVAERLYLEALALARSAAGAEAEEVLILRNSLGELHYRRGETERARHLFEEVLAIRRRTLFADDPALAISLNNLAAAEQARSHWSRARTLLIEVLAIRRRVFGERHVEVALALTTWRRSSGRAATSRAPPPISRKRWRSPASATAGRIPRWRASCTTSAPSTSSAGNRRPPSGSTARPWPCAARSCPPAIRWWRRPCATSASCSKRPLPTAPKTFSARPSRSTGGPWRPAIPASPTRSPASAASLTGAAIWRPPKASSRRSWASAAPRPATGAAPTPRPGSGGCGTPPAAGKKAWCCWRKPSPRCAGCSAPSTRARPKRRASSPPAGRGGPDHPGRVRGAAPPRAAEAASFLAAGRARRP